MSTTRDSIGGSPAGTQTAALAFAGNTLPNNPTTATESYTGPTTSVKTITAS